MSFGKRPPQRAPGVTPRIRLFLGRRRPVRPRVFPLDADAYDLIAHHAGVIGLAVEGHITVALELLVEKPAVPKTYWKRLHAIPRVFRCVQRSNFNLLPPGRLAGRARGGGGIFCAVCLDWR